MLPGIVSIVVAIILFNSGIVNVRGFVGLSYATLSLFLIVAGSISLLIGKNSNHKSYIQTIHTQAEEHANSFAFFVRRLLIFIFDEGFSHRK